MADRGVMLIAINGSPMSCRPQIALLLKCVEYEYKPEENHEKKSPELLKYNPIHKKVPVLVHEGKPIAESQVILEYIDETWEYNPILPKDPYERARARFWGKFIDDKCLPSILKAYTGAPEERESSMEEAIQNLKFLEKEVEDKKYFGGQSIGFVDIVASFFAFWLPIMEEVSGKMLMSNGNYPNLCRWKDDIVSCNVMKECFPDKEPFASLFRMRLGVSSD